MFFLRLLLRMPTRVLLSSGKPDHDDRPGGVLSGPAGCRAEGTDGALVRGRVLRSRFPNGSGLSDPAPQASTSRWPSQTAFRQTHLALPPPGSPRVTALAEGLAPGGLGGFQLIPNLPG